MTPLDRIPDRRPVPPHTGLTLEDALPDAPVLDTGAGHDAGILAAHVPTAMLFVRNPTGVSHAHEEHVEDDDAETGAEVLADALMGDLGIA